MNMKNKDIKNFSPSDFQILLDDDQLAEIAELIELKEITTKEIPLDLKEAIYQLSIIN